MFHFNRRTLWIIIYITIPLIFILNSLGPVETGEDSTTADLQYWSLDRVELRCERFWCLASLTGAPRLHLSVISDRVPDAQIEMPEDLAVDVYQRRGLFVVHIEMETDLKSLKNTTRFLQKWLPDSKDLNVVVTGDINDQMLKQLESLADGLSGTGIDNIIEPVSGLGVLESPELGSHEQLSFLIWVEVLKGRLSGYDVTAQWDHRRNQSYVVFNSTLSQEAFSDVSENEFNTVLSAYMVSARVKERTAEQIHRYAVTAAIYELPFAFFITQPERLESLTLDSVNKMRELSFGQITKKHDKQ